MAKFDITAHVTISIYKTVEAKNEKQARTKALELELPNLCHQCAGAGEGDPDVWELTGELDGEPQIQKIEAM
jgi:hypothetical protein